MTENTKISVIMPVYNTEIFLREAIESVLAQTWPHWELIVVDDGSTDGSAAICDEYAALDSRITVRHTPNRGVDPARNLGIELAGGEWLAFLDSDDFLTPDTLKILAAHAENCDAVIAGYRETPGVKRYQAVAASKRIPRLSDSAEEFIRIDRSFVLSCLHAKLFRKTAIHRLFREDQPFADDTWFNIDNLFTADGIVFLPDFLYIYRRRSDSGALHNTQAGRLETSHALMHAMLDAFPGSGAVRNHLTGKMIIRIHNHLVRLLSHTKDEAERKSMIADLLDKPLFHDSLLLITEAPLPELRGFWTALLKGDAQTVSELLSTDSRPIRSDSPGMISVILPVYNMEQTLGTAVGSILSQTYSHWELIIVDDGSTDSCGVLADIYMEKDARILVLHQENHGAGAARNRALSCTNGEWLAFLDADDEYLPECFEQMIRASNGADLVACGSFLESYRTMCMPFEEIRSFDGLPSGREFRLFWANYILLVVWAKLYRRQLVRESFVTDVTYGEDTLFNFKVFPSLGRITVIPELGYIYHMRRKRLDRGMLEGSRRMLESAAAWLPENMELLRLSYVAFVRSARQFAQNILDSEELTSEETTKELAFCNGMIRLPPELDHEEFLFPENLEWWRQLKAGDVEQAVAGQRIILEEGKKRLDVLYPDGWTFAPRG